MRTIATLLLAFTLSGCSTMYFQKRSDTAQAEKTASQWKHDFLFGLIESGAPVNLQTKCQATQDWVEIKIEKNALQAILTNPIWDPWNLAYSCR